MASLISFFSTYLFLLSGVYFLISWIVLFLSFYKHRDIQKKILIASVIMMLATPFVEHINLADWWSPVFLYKGFFHIEDLLFGFAITGTTLGIYYWVSKSVWAKIQEQAHFSAGYKRFVLLSTILLMFVPFYFFHIPSFYTEVACMIFLPVLVFVRVPTMILPTIVTGILLTIIILPGYFLGNYLSPGWIQEFWKLAGWSGELFLTVPIGEYVFYIFFGLFLPAFQELLFAKK